MYFNLVIPGTRCIASSEQVTCYADSNASVCLRLHTYDMFLSSHVTYASLRCGVCAYPSRNVTELHHVLYLVPFSSSSVSTAQAVSRRLPTVTACVRYPVRWTKWCCVKFSQTISVSPSNSHSTTAVHSSMVPGLVL
jgi:hypothetical protein